MELKKYGILAAISILTLSGCVTREQADAKLAKGCAAGAEALLPEGGKVNNIIESTFGPSPEGPGMRHVKIKTATMDGWLEEEKTYECIFEESFGIFKSNHTASIYQVRTGEQIYGKAGNEIKGSTEDFIRLTDAIRKAMYEQ